MTLIRAIPSERDISASQTSRSCRDISKCSSAYAWEAPYLERLLNEDLRELTNLRGAEGRVLRGGTRLALATNNGVRSNNGIP